MPHHGYYIWAPFRHFNKHCRVNFGDGVPRGARGRAPPTMCPRDERFPLGVWDPRLPLATHPTTTTLRNGCVSTYSSEIDTKLHLGEVILAYLSPLQGVRGRRLHALAAVYAPTHIVHYGISFYLSKPINKRYKCSAGTGFPVCVSIDPL